ncbi:hypothetical protein [Aquincola tertiaricarbonis]|uniref:hypothetical protein n=1 Tax=Aquincola tertiaricarbonis TaxID=391953 RepID=UPI0012ECEFD2|nr:hypothetical protein [Aquincola tertiaricarbonis]
MRFVAIKNNEQQALRSWHRVRQRFFKARTAQANPICGRLGEYGLVVPQGIVTSPRIPPLIEDANNALLGCFRRLIQPAAGCRDQRGHLAPYSACHASDWSDPTAGVRHGL